jgi:hypothetical protein
MFEGKSSRRKIDASKEKGSKKEETLENARAISRWVFARPLDEKPLERFFLLARETLAACSRIVLETHSGFFPGTTRHP